MKTAVSVWSFQRLIGRKELDHFTVLQKIKDYGFDAVEYIDLYLPEGKTEEEYAREIRAEADRLGLEISAYSLSCDLLNGSGGDLEKELERLYRKIDVAEILGAKIVRHDITPHPPKGYVGYVNLLPRFVEASRKLCDYATAKGIRTCTENHGYFSQDSERVKAIVEGVNYDNFGTLVDIGNFLCVDEAPEKAVAVTSPYAFYAHAKDFCVKSKEEMLSSDGFFKTRGGNYLKGAILGHGDVPVLKCLEIVKNNGYNGYVTLEFEGLEEAKMGCTYGLNTLKAIKEKLNW
jgi:sugar phosphate isomerase/epimerase